MKAEDIRSGAEIIIPPGAIFGGGRRRPCRIRIQEILHVSKATGAIEVGGVFQQLSGAPSQRRRKYTTVLLHPGTFERIELAREAGPCGDPAPSAT